MADKFTNIAGGAFLPYVTKQIENRKKFVEEYNGKRENKHLIYFNNKNAWIRLTSCVDVTESHPLFAEYGLSGAALARKYVLQGGTVQNDNGKITNRFGVEPNGSYSMLPSKPLGFKPMPGITSIDLSSAGKLGTLQYATIKFIAYDIKQLELVDALYMKLGFSLVLEWGHTVYLDENSNLSNPKPLDVFSYTNKEQLVRAIQKKRIDHSGNYDAMVGTTSNFGWEIQDDGSYLCDIKLVGAGDILDSLKINQAVNKNTNFLSKPQNTGDEEDKKNITSQIADKNLSVLNKALFSIYQQVNNTPSRDSGVTVLGVNSPSYKKVLNKIYNNTPYKFISFNDKGNIIGDENAIKGNHYSLISELNKNNGGDKIQIPNISNTLFTSVGVSYNITDNEGNGNDEKQIYITLGHLLALITATGMIYNKGGDDIKPYIYIDFNDKLNYCATFKGQMSIDPRVCIIPRNQNNLDDPFGLGIMEDRIFNDINGVIVEKEYTPSNISGGPGYASTYEEGEVKYKREVRSDSFVNNYLNVTPEEKEVRARMMCILVNINYITDILRNQRDKDGKGNVNFSEFLNSLLDGISKALGGFNEFRVVVDDSNKCVRLVDDNKLSLQKELEDSTQYTEIPILGNKSIVYNYNFRSKISPKMASMVTIAAQAEPSALGDDAFAISNLSRGLIDRISAEKTTSNFSPSTPTTPDPAISEDNLKTLIQHLESIMGSGGSNFDINISSIDPSINIYRGLLSEYRIAKDSINKASVIIPLDFNITMDGISGIIPNSAFTIPVNLLPSSYKTKDNLPKIAFIIHSISQDFSNNKWTTKIIGQTLSIRFDKEDIKTYTNYNPSQNQQLLELIPGQTNPFIPVLIVPDNIVQTNKSLTKLKNIIGNYESGNNYGVANTGGKGMRSSTNVSGMSFQNIKSLQNISSESDRRRVFASGRFQIIPSTMNILKVALKFKDNDRYTPQNQEKMGDHMLLEFRYIVGNYIKGINKGSSIDLANAINNIGYEWASMPVVTKSGGELVGNVITGVGQIANYGGTGGNPNFAKVDIKTIANALIKTRIEYSGKTPIFMPKYYDPWR